MRTLTDWIARIATWGWRELAVSGALALAVALAAGVALGGPGSALAAGGSTYTSCAESTANFPTDLAGVTSGSATFTFPANCTIDLTSPLKVGAGVDITINGNSLTLDGQMGNFDLIVIRDTSAASTLKLDQVTLEQSGTGFGIDDQGNQATVTLEHGSTISGTNFGILANAITVNDSTITDNAATGIDANASASSMVTVTGSTISDNGGDGIYSTGAVSVDTSTISGNAAAKDVTEFGGIVAGSATVTNSMITNNTGAGIDAGSVTVAGSTLSGNTTDGVDAGSANVTTTTISDNGTNGVLAGAGASVTDSTISGNGGDGVYTNGAANVTNSTISGNASGSGVSFPNGIVSGIVAGSANVTSSTIVGNADRGIDAASASLTATILAGNGTTNCDIGRLTDERYNLSTDGSCGFGPTASMNNVTAAQLNLLPLGSYGGPTETMALGPGSIAIGAIPTTDCTSLPTADQRGIDRPQGSGCDVGAYEAPAVTLAADPASPTSSGWYNASQIGLGGTLPVTASFSGLADGNLPSCSGASFNGLPTSPVSGLNQTATGTVSLSDGSYAISCGVSQGSMLLGVSQSPTQPVTFQVDSTPPVIDLTTPANGASYGLDKTVDASYSCGDPTPGSGLASCTGTVASGNPIDTSTTGSHSFMVTAEDVAGNTASQTVSYNVTGSTLCTLYDPSQPHQAGSTAVITVTVCDPTSGADLSTTSMTLVATSLTDANGTSYPVLHPGDSFPGNAFTFDPTLGTSGGFQFNLETTGLPSGTYQLAVTVNGSPAANTLTVIVR